MQIKKSMLVGVVVVLLVLVAGGAFYYKSNKNKGYSVVYMSTGEIYVGKLSVYNDLVLKDTYILQTTKDPANPAKVGFQLQPTDDIIWATKELHLVKDNVIFYGPLSEASKIAETLAAQKVK